jgi:hypothetical protein
MTSQLLLASQETHDPIRQQFMQDIANKTAQSIKKQEGVIGVVLSGSTARGPVSASSDLDLHVIVSSTFTGRIREWTLHEGGIIENLHTISEDEFLRGWNVRNNPDALATWFHKTKLGDELHQFISLWWNPTTQWSKRLLELITLRQIPDIAQRIALRYAESARAYIRQANNACNDESPLDGHHQLRPAFQATLVAAMIQHGWIIRGSKKRIEIAQAFLPDPVIENILTIGLNIVGLNNMTPSKATILCKARLQYRTILLNELRELEVRYAQDGHVASKLEQAIKQQEIHDAMAYDYYTSLVSQNIILGPINHIRCISGLPRVPQLFFACLSDKKSWPIQEFVRLDILSREVRDAWLQIMGLESSKQKCINLASNLSAVIDNLVDKHLSN